MTLCPILQPKILMMLLVVNSLHYTKNERFPLRISPVNMTKSVEICGFGHIGEILNGKILNGKLEKSLMENLIFCS